MAAAGAGGREMGSLRRMMERERVWRVVRAARVSALVGAMVVGGERSYFVIAVVDGGGDGLEVCLLCSGCAWDRADG